LGEKGVRVGGDSSWGLGLRGTRATFTASAHG
jgi:hypothetical protein